MQPRTDSRHAEVSLTPGTWVRILAVGASFCALFYHFLLNQMEISRDPDWSHAYLIPAISAYYIYENRGRILALPARANWLGLPLMLLGVGLYFFFTLGPTANHTLQGAAMICTLLGLVLLLLGARLWWALMFPMLYLAMGVRMPPRLLLMVTPTLQVWASKGSYYLLNLLGYDTDISGTVLTVYHNGKTLPLNVAEACSGMRMIVAFIALGIAMAFLTCKAWWQRLALIFMGVPVAIFVNVLRVASLGIASTINPDLARGEAHVFIGTLWLIPAILIYLGLVWIVQHVFISVSDGGPGEPMALQRPAASPRLSAAAVAAPRWLAPAVCVGLLAGAVAFAPVQDAMGIYLRKEPVPLRAPLSTLPVQVGPWKAIGSDEIVSPEVIREFGTEEYLTRNFARDGDASSGVLQLHVAYYTGSIDAVPHIPDRCFVGGGLVRSPTTTAVPLDIDQSLWWPDPDTTDETGAAGEGGYLMAITSGPARQVVRMPRLGEVGLRLNSSEYWRQEDREHTLAAGYFFIANGGVTASPEGVRLLAYDRSSKYAYYCKVQFTYQHPTSAVDRTDLGREASEFLGLMLPDLMACLPDWQDVEQGRWEAPPEVEGAGN